MSELKAVVFDWAGTIVDFGSRAPMGAFVEVFKRFGVEITIAEARKPMGLPKWDHIAALLADAEIAARWQDAHGQLPGKAEADKIYEVFVPLNAEVVADYADLIPGAVEAVVACRARGLKIGSTTGYTREIMARLIPHAEAAGYTPDNLVCAGDLAAGRPTPLMMWKTFLDLNLQHPAWTVVKVDDTEPGIAEGLAAGTWTVGVALSGNALGLSLDEFETMSPLDVAPLEDRAYSELTRAGAHYVIDTIEDLIPVLDDIEGRLKRGERP